MLEHISISGRSAPAPRAVATPNWDRMPRFEDRCMGMDFEDQATQRPQTFSQPFGFSTEFRELRGLITTLEKLLSVNLVEHGTSFTNEAFSQPHADIATSMPSTTPHSFGSGSPTPPTQQTAFVPMCDCSSAVDSKSPNGAYIGSGLTHQIGAQDL
jgi:hypothetical protein